MQTMDSIKGQGGIQMLLSAEQEARQIVSDARDLKLKRLKQAKDEAESDTALYRYHLEAEYQKSLTSGSSASNVHKLEQETEEKIKHLKESADRVAPQIIQLVTKHITTVKL